MYQAYRPAQRNKPTAQKDLPDIPCTATSREIVGDAPMPREYAEPVQILREQTIRNEKMNLIVERYQRYRVTGTRSYVTGCLIKGAGKVEVDMAGHITHALVYGTLVVGPGGRVMDIQVYDGGKVLIENGGKAKRIFKVDGKGKIECMPKGHYSEAIVSRVNGFPIKI